MAEVDVLQVAMSADTKNFQQGMSAAEVACAKALQSTDQLGHAIDELTKEMQKEAEAAAQSKEQHTASASSIGFATTAWNLAAEAVTKLVGGLVEFGQKAIEAANAMDPSGAAKWASSVSNLRSSFMSFAGQIGKELRPAIEAVMDAFTRMFNTLKAYDWHAIFQSLFTILDALWNKIKSNGSAILDALTWPFRTAVGIIEAGLGKLMEWVGEAMNKLGNTMIGKKLGFDANSGDAFKETGADMVKQAKVFQESFSGAAGEVGKGLLFSLDQALTAAGQSAAWEKLKNAVAKGPTKTAAETGEFKDARTLKMEQTAFDIEMEHRKAAFEQRQLEDQEHINSIKEGIAVERASTQERLASAKTTVDLLRSGLADAYSRHDQAGIADYTAKLDAAMNKMREAGDAANAAMASAYDKESQQEAKLTLQAAATKVMWEDAQRVAENARRLAASAGTPQQDQVAAQAKATADQLHAEYTAINAQAIQAHQAAAAIDAQSAQQAAQVKKDTAQEVAAIEQEKAKELAKIRDAQMKGHLDAVTGTMSGSTGSLVTSLIQGIKEADPFGALVNAAVGIVGKSKGFQDLIEALNTILDAAGTAVGRLFQGIAPIIQMLGNDIAPILDGVGNLLLLVGESVTAVVTPLLSALNPLFASIGQLVTAIAPVVPMIVMLVMTLNLAVPTLILLDLALRLLAVPIDLLGQGIKFVTDKMVEGWNWMVGQMSHFIDLLSVIPGIGDMFADVAKDVDAMKISLDSVTPAATQAAAALAQLAQRGLSLDDALKALHNPDASTEQKAIAQAEVGAAFTSAMNYLPGVTKAMFDQAVATALQDGTLDPYLQKVKAASSSYDQALAQSASAQQKVMMDQAQEDALLAAMERTSDPVVRAQLQKQYDQLSAQTKLDQDAFAVAQDQASLAEEQLKIAQDQLQATILLAELQEAERTGNTAAINSLTDALFGANGIVGQIQSDNAAADATRQQLAEDMAQQALDQAMAATANTTATAANTKATQDLNEHLTNMISGFNLNNAIYHASGGGPRDDGPSAPIRDSLDVNARQSASGLHIYGNVIVDVDSKDPNDFANRVEDAMRGRKFRVNGAPVSGDAGEY